VFPSDEDFKMSRIYEVCYTNGYGDRIDVYVRAETEARAIELAKPESKDWPVHGVRIFDLPDEGVIIVDEDWHEDPYSSGMEIRMEEPAKIDAAYASMDREIEHHDGKHEDPSPDCPECK
jgi:hypothetical protein